MKRPPTIQSGWLSRRAGVLSFAALVFCSVCLFSFLVPVFLCVAGLILVLVGLVGLARNIRRDAFDNPVKKIESQESGAEPGPSISLACEQKTRRHIEEDRTP